jgi:predicted esterase
MIVAGASQGGVLAMQAANEAGLPWLSVVPSFPRGYDVGPFTAVPTHTAGAVLLGEHDPAAAGARAVVSQLEAAGVRITVKTMRGAGHELPPDFAAYAAEALRALLP